VVGELPECGALRQVIDLQDGGYQTHEAGDAHRRVETRHKAGSVVLHISEDQSMDSKSVRPGRTDPPKESR
jgi:hypothetical protein